MNEIMEALEAMVRRVVKEEMASQAAAPTPAATFGVSPTPGPEFHAAVKACVLDQPWFESAIQYELAEMPVQVAPAPVQAAPAPVQAAPESVAALTNRMKDAIRSYPHDFRVVLNNLEIMPGGITFTDMDAFNDAVHRCVRDDARINDIMHDNAVDILNSTPFTVRVG